MGEAVGKGAADLGAAAVEGVKGFGKVIGRADLDKVGSRRELWCKGGLI